MHTPRLLAALAGATLAHAAAAAPVTAIVFRGGSKTPAEAEAALAAWGQVADQAAAFAALPQGFPKIVESSRLPGMRPGYHAVVLGFCPAAKAAELLPLFQAVDPGIYAREVDAPEACPVLQEGPWTVEGPVKAKAGANTLIVVAANNAAERGFAVATLLDGSGNVLERRMVGERCASFELARLDRSRVRVKGVCTVPRCMEPLVYEDSWTLEAEEAIAVKEREGKTLQEGKCDW